MRAILKIFVIWAVFSAGLAIADEDWKLRKDKDGIQVYTKNIEGSAHAAVRSTTIINGVTLASFVALINDAEACSDWADKCAESYVHERVSDTELFVYTHNDLPFPVKDRDVLAHIKWTQDDTTLEVVMNSEATTGVVDEVEGRLRLTDAKASWRFRPLASGDIEVTSDAHINPGSSLPGWITNRLLVKTPFETMKSFAAEVLKPKYQNAVVSFVTEPTNSSG